MNPRERNRSKPIRQRGGNDRLSWPARRRSLVDHAGSLPAVREWSDCIVAIARTRDRQQFALLFSHFAPRLKAFFARLGVAPGASEDLVQDVMLAVWNKADRFDPALASASTWIFTIARNLRIDAARRDRSARQLPDYEDVETEAGPDDRLMSVERELRVRDALKTLSADQASVIRLSFFEDRPQSEIASVLNIPLGTVKSRVRLAMNRLRALVEDLQ